MGVRLAGSHPLLRAGVHLGATEEYFDRTINFVKVQSNSHYEKYNDTIKAKRCAPDGGVLSAAAGGKWTLDLYDPESLRAETESSGLPGIAKVLDENGRITV